MELQPITPDSLDDEALTDLIEIRKSGVDHHASEGNKVQHAIQSLTLIALVELQQRRDADSSAPIYQWRERYEEGSLWDDCTKAQYDGFAKKTDCEVRILYTAPPAPVVPDAANGLMPCPFCGGKAHQLTIEQDDDPHFGGDVITCTECGASSHVEFGFKENLKSAWNSRTAMLQAGNHTEQHLDMVDHSGDDNEKVKDGTLINEGTTPVKQIKPVADLYGITSPTGSETTFTFDASEASSFVGSGWSVQEYVELERYQEAITGK
ncbi:restriction alleviation protein, Lar family [Citrobacter freundii]|uniref:Lar family restriction alleviation protein n=1 Tax=Citrobacter freundii TaxID=546 RepID=UPI000D045E2B|nr:Lar family restriction alleviation protein [Citrobacter freundii]QAT69546.1 restriction alleviation protein, Lar family [Citrobacter freundii]